MPSFYARSGKRLFDAIFSFFGLFLLAPVLFVIAIAVRLSSPGPALFSQVRTGRGGRTFRILKFRSMRASRNSDAGSLLTASDDSRITPLGRWLRKTKADELPQLFNVLFGHMSLVGPRPEVPRYADCYSLAQRQVFSARPGITGPSIIFNEERLMAGRPDKERFYIDAIIPAKLEIDLAYSSNIRFASDLRFLALTLARLFRSPSDAGSHSIHLASPSGSLDTISDKR
jgi:lipopolysaccharide/colanic/teichoic acid biosynthesis glycosyltransferase